MSTFTLPSRSVLLPAAFLLAACAALPAQDAPAFAGTDCHKYYLDVCARCHGANGNGRDNSGAQLPKAGFDFTDSRKANKKKDADWLKITLEGKDEMPAFKGKMTPDQVTRMIAEVLRPFAAKS
jgi:mono/diheme cytochrome c family protein